ncbi:MAG: four helix bundle protein [Saprospiraceae bacterium]
MTKYHCYKPNDPLGEKTFKFAIRIVNLSIYLKKQKKETVIAHQILRSGTNPGAMIKEAQSAESGKDFIHKLSIAQKEISETQYWLHLLFATHFIAQNEFESLFEDTQIIKKLLISSIKTKKRNLNK